MVTMPEIPERTPPMPPETPETAPERTHVPDELLLAGLVCAWNDGREQLEDFEVDYDNVQWLEEALCAVLPAHEAMVRAKVAEEIAEPTVWPDPFGRWTADQADAAKVMKQQILRRIARGTQP